MTRSGTLDVGEIDRLEIYVNSKKLKENKLSSILAATGGDFLFNGTIFSWSSYKPLCHCKAAGTLLCKPDYTVYGLSWDAPSSFKEDVLPCSASNYVACVPLIIKGKKVAKPNYQPDMGGSRPRTALGVKGGRLAYYVTSTGYTPEKLRDYLFSIGWDSATMLDGGGSTCFWDKSGGFVCDGSRAVQHFIVVHLKRGEYDELKGAKPMVTINAYSKAKQGSVKLSDNFTVKEFACSDGSDAVFVAPSLVELLQKIRTHYGKPVVVNSGYRTTTYNAKVGGVAQSQHTYGTAADITISGVTPQALAAYVETLIPKTGGIGIYDNDKQGHFVHVDVRDTRARW